ncbi:hypothetical protein Tco_0109086, partial [Tanacetum coccineum]
GQSKRADKENKALSHEEMSSEEKQETDSDSDNDTRPSSAMVESSKSQLVKKFSFNTKLGKNVKLAKEETKNEKPEEERLKLEAIEMERNKGKQLLLKIIGQQAMEDYYKNKIVYDKYYLMLLNIKAQAKINNIDILTRKGPIVMKIYRDDGTSETIREFRISDLHLTEWKEVLDKYGKRNGKSWAKVYQQMKTKINEFNKMGELLELDHTIPLGEQDPNLQLNRLAKKKRRDFVSTQDYFRSTKRYKESVKFDKHSIRTVLNEFVLGMIYFNDLYR